MPERVELMGGPSDGAFVRSEHLSDCEPGDSFTVPACSGKKAIYILEECREHAKYLRMARPMEFESI